MVFVVVMGVVESNVYSISTGCFLAVVLQQRHRSKVAYTIPGMGFQRDVGEVACGFMAIIFF